MTCLLATPVERKEFRPRDILESLNALSFTKNPVDIDNISNLLKPGAKGTHLKLKSLKLERAIRRIPAIQGKDHSECSLADVVIHRRRELARLGSYERKALSRRNKLITPLIV